MLALAPTLLPAIHEQWSLTPQLYRYCKSLLTLIKCHSCLAILSHCLSITSPTVISQLNRCLQLPCTDATSLMPHRWWASVILRITCGGNTHTCCKTHKLGSHVNTRVVARHTVHYALLFATVFLNLCLRATLLFKPSLTACLLLHIKIVVFVHYQSSLMITIHTVLNVCILFSLC